MTDGTNHCYGKVDWKLFENDKENVFFSTDKYSVSSLWKSDKNAWDKIKSVLPKAKTRKPESLTTQVLSERNSNICGNVRENLRKIKTKGFQEPVSDTDQAPSSRILNVPENLHKFKASQEPVSETEQPLYNKEMNAGEPLRKSKRKPYDEQPETFQESVSETKQAKDSSKVNLPDSLRKIKVEPLQEPISETTQVLDNKKLDVYAPSRKIQAGTILEPDSRTSETLDNSKSNDCEQQRKLKREPVDYDEKPKYPEIEICESEEYGEQHVHPEIGTFDSQEYDEQPECLEIEICEFEESEKCFPNIEDNFNFGSTELDEGDDKELYENVTDNYNSEIYLYEPVAFDAEGLMNDTWKNSVWLCPFNGWEKSKELLQLEEAYSRMYESPKRPAYCCCDSDIPPNSPIPPPIPSTTTIIRAK